jgi:hypothetical protein
MDYGDSLTAGLKEIAMESANSTPLSHAREWFIPLMDWTGSGDFWSAGMMTGTKEDAEMQIRNSTTEVKQGRIVRVVLPCKVIP